jgi:hypothetical protein
MGLLPGLAPKSARQSVANRLAEDMDKPKSLVLLACFPSESDKRSNMQGMT